MAEALPDPDQSPIPNQLPSGSNSILPQYWCYQCNKRVSVETLSDLPDVVCYDCKNGFVESISISVSPISDDPTSGNPLVQVLRLIAQTALEDNAPPPPQSEPLEEDYLRIELDGWDNDDDEDDYDEQSVEVIHEDEVENRDHYPENRSNDEENDLDEPRGEDQEDEMLRRRRELLGLRLRDFATRATNRRNRILDWAEILMGLEDHPFDLRLHVPESETYVGNPGDYVDAAGYEALLLNLADSDTGGRRGAPPAAKWVIERLESILIQKEQEKVMCSICKDYVNAGENAQKLPCGHLYHGECIITWLGSRNSCPVCRFELPTDDTEYEEERKRRIVAAGLRPVPSSSSGSGGSRPDAAFD
ncbi:E3 ubiquitin-protein ligase CIP8-like [Primulina eburnea]|uniref:E3 ubiquitin-protein ligase CIP8-like n=1 Tax=Primulina eburnea TaxID=1245227 RepID=UPI003C6C9B5B